ncbi:MAG: hypothetical protein Q7N50_02435 [Armatimonadota bacterium]|nr:hypothetical protein [Armatimonadota bacterium]
MDTVTPERLEDLARVPEEIIRNPYRILGVATSASATDIRHACEERVAALHTNTPLRATDYLSFLGKVDITPETIERARRSLQDVKKRELHTFFWLSFAYDAAPAVRAALGQGDLASGLSILERELQSCDGLTKVNVAHDSGLLQLMSAYLEDDIEFATAMYSCAVDILLRSAQETVPRASSRDQACKTLLESIAERAKGCVSHLRIADACAICKALTDVPPSHADAASTAMWIPISPTVRGNNLFM